MSEEEKSYLCCESCGQFYEEGSFHDCRISESEEILSERQWIEGNKEKSEEEQLEEMMKPLVEKKSYKQLLSASILELAKQDLQETGRVQSKEFYEEEAKRHLLREALRQKYSKVPERERYAYYRGLRDVYETWKKKLWSGEFKDIKGNPLYVCPVCGRASKDMDVTYSHFEREHPEQVKWLIRVSDLLEGKFDRYKEYRRKESKEEKSLDILLDKKEELSAKEDKTHLRNLTILTALTRRKEEE